MRKALKRAAGAESLRDVLARVGPAELAAHLKDGPGFRLKFAGAQFAPERVDGSPARYRLAGTGIVADVEIEFSTELGAAVQRVKLTNEGAEPSPPIQEIDAFFLPLEVRASDRPRACGFGGGLTDGFYPPRAYREEEVCFGEARDWLPRCPTWQRWWVGKGIYRLESIEAGRSSNPFLPVMQAGWRIGGGSGEVGLWAALEWSGRWRLEFGNAEDWLYRFAGGPRVKGMVLAAGESVRLPRVHVGACGGPGATRSDGLNRIRRYVAEALSPDAERRGPEGVRPWPYAAYNTWFGIHEAVNEELLYPQADRAAELGLEYFVIDAAWYAGSTENFWPAVGNWESVDSEKFPRGLEPVADYARSKGLRFGLWFEPERAGGDTDWARKHRDWFWKASGPYYHIDWTSRTAQDGVIEALSEWVSRLDIRWLRWDNNQAPGPFWDSVDATGKVQFAYCDGLYRVLDELLRRHPDLMIDNCAGGGNRVDFGTLGRAGTMVISDHAEDPHVCRIMQTGGARVFPANLMNSSLYVGEADASQSAKPLPIISRMAGSITFCGHISRWTAAETRRVRRYVDGFKSYRHLLMKDFHPLSPYPRAASDPDVAEFVDPAGGEAVILAYRVRGGDDALRARPVGLAPGREYEIADPFSSRKPRTAAGAELMERGLRIGLAEESGAARHLKPIS